MEMEALFFRKSPLYCEEQTAAECWSSRSTDDSLILRNEWALSDFRQSTGKISGRRMRVGSCPCVGTSVSQPCRMLSGRHRWTAWPALLDTHFNSWVWSAGMWQAEILVSCSSGSAPRPGGSVWRTRFLLRFSASYSVNLFIIEKFTLYYKRLQQGAAIESDGVDLQGVLSLLLQKGRMLKVQELSVLSPSIFISARNCGRFWQHEPHTSCVCQGSGFGGC